MHINTVKVEDFWVSYDIECVNGEIQIVAHFVKEGKEIYIYDINNGSTSGAEMVAKLLDTEFAKAETARMIEETNKSKHSPLR